MLGGGKKKSIAPARNQSTIPQPSHLTKQGWPGKTTHLVSQFLLWKSVWEEKCKVAVSRIERLRIRDYGQTWRDKRKWDKCNFSSEQNNKVSSYKYWQSTSSMVRCELWGLWKSCNTARSGTTTKQLYSTAHFLTTWLVLQKWILKNQMNSDMNKVIKPNPLRKIKKKKFYCKN